MARLKSVTECLRQDGIVWAWGWNDSGQPSWA
ncbi:hypothetical protein JY651_48225 [Pyxidicoccus parkwayensis]|uniref:Uncharacterized protein n=1 Tax=Pyxidicoccus parkwayensis TaxID=2813578 RepID=A0ABX7NV48_9BACT|nr:hypothetical protein JY651_48225 [Pyxidicoccus parkwaysis]